MVSRCSWETGSGQSGKMSLGENVNKKVTQTSNFKTELFLGWVIVVHNASSN